MNLRGIKGLIPADLILQRSGSRHVAAFCNNLPDLSRAERGVIHLPRSACAVRCAAACQSVCLFFGLARPCLKAPDGDLGLWKNLADVFDEVAPAPGLGGQAVKHRVIRLIMALLDAKGQSGGPIGLVAANGHADAQRLTFKGGGKTAQPRQGLAVKLRLAEVMRHGAMHVFFGNDDPVRPTLIGMGKGKSNATYGALADPVICRCDLGGVAHKACKKS